MNTWKTRTVAAAAIMAGLGLGITAIATAAPTSTPTVAVTATAVDAAAAKQLAFMREEERLAHDVYTEIYKLYPDATAFSRIANAEQRHHDAMGVLLTRYGLADPSASKSVGTYAEPALTELYAKLMTQAKISVTEAYKVGVAIEETDIADLKTSLAGNAPTDVKAVYTNLQAGSDNHLATFTALRDGKAVAMGNGAGMQNGRGQAAGTSTTPTRGMGYGRTGTGVGTGIGAGVGTGIGSADCPLR
jgi:hypothetical protein